MREEQAQRGVQRDGRTAATIMAMFFVYASGLNSRPPALRERGWGGTKPAITSRLKKLAPPTSLTALMMTSFGVTLPPVCVPILKALCASAPPPRCRIHQRADGDGDAAQRHDVRRHAIARMGMKLMSTASGVSA